MNVVLKKLKKYYNYDSLYNFQENVIKNVLNGKDIFVLAKTSGGKSICYQLPALVVRGITIIICPLRSLIEDQVNNLKKRNIKFLTFYGDMNLENKQNVLNLLNKSHEKMKIHMLYTTPECIEKNQDFLDSLIYLSKKNLLTRFVIDEAHTVSLWGNNFRNSYLWLKELKNIFPNTPITALTATATYITQKDILNILQINNAIIIRDKLIRNNLYLDIRPSFINKNNDIINFIKNKYYKKPGIIFCIKQVF